MKYGLHQCQMPRLKEDREKTRDLMPDPYRLIEGTLLIDPESARQARKARYIKSAMACKSSEQLSLDRIWSKK
jgi:hypothetical protein